MERSQDAMKKSPWEHDMGSQWLLKVSFLRSNCLADFQEILMNTYYTYTSIILNIFIIDSL